MGYVFEHLLRKFNEALNQNPGEHFTPREVIRLMGDLVLMFDINLASGEGVVGKVGYEIPFNRHFYVFQPPRKLSAIDADLNASTDRILTMIGGLTK